MEALDLGAVILWGVTLLPFIWDEAGAFWVAVRLKCAKISHWPWLGPLQPLAHTVSSWPSLSPVPGF